MKKLPIGEARELPDAEAWAALYAEFGWPTEPTQPMPLEELPAAFELQPVEQDELARVFDVWSKTNAK